MRFLVVWEDAYFDGLSPFIRRRLRAVEAGRTPAHLAFFAAQGNGRFTNIVSKWSAMRERGLPTDPGPLDHVICVADADRVHEPLHCEAPPKDLAHVPDWHVRTQGRWEEHLRLACEPHLRSTVHGALLRWSKESLALAGYDQPPFREHLNIDVHEARVRKVLEECVPDPSKVEQAKFTDAFRKPVKCLSTLRGRDLKKDHPSIDDLLKALAGHYLDVVRSRVPDIDAIVQTMVHLSTLD